MHLWAGDLERARAAFEAAPEGLLEDSYWFLLPVAHVRAVRGDTAGARRLLELARARAVRAPTNAFLSYVEVGIPAVFGDVSAARRALGEYVDRGGGTPAGSGGDPVFGEARRDPGFRATLGELERIVERQRRAIERHPDGRR